MIDYIKGNNTTIAVIDDSEVVIDSVNAALDLVMTINYESGADKIVISKEAITEEFFVLSSGLAGEILQKFINYHIKFAVYGDYSKYTSKPLKDFIYESNQGKDFFFVETKEQAIEKLND
ncbi:hypothetical protein M2454_002269 [Aequitasia blattaphilus]|uniref:DUF4180 domain-containing protein n=1 Tax=Aequitasia blattaphilus TaxID=2949332 RepID=A0ABT1EEZ7_9FIRM|nr:DUF4180 domain-containing protein [Aequitasia blattaphilus]MCP1103416.1 DUF4180 domain-containing protein [Aequitasia blattaphilus]MCR8616056.1 DUF4180 domain-containing protein [Aequitasia blattaphilus]